MNLAQFMTYVSSMGVPRAYPNNLAPATDMLQFAGVQPIVLTNNTQTSASVVNPTANNLLELAALHNTLLVGTQAISTGTGDDTTSGLPTSVVKKPWLDAPDGSLPFDFGGAVALGGVGTTVIVPMTPGVALYSFRVPTGYDGVINAYSWNFTGGGFTDGSGDLVGQIFRNTAAVRNYDAMLNERGTTTIPRNTAPIRIYSNDLITLQVQHASNGLLAGDIVGSFVGYFYPNAS